MTIQANYDSAAWSQLPYYNVTAKLWVRSPETVQTENYVEDLFDIVIKEKCRLVQKNNPMQLQSKTVQSIAKSSGPHYGTSGSGTTTAPYQIEMFDRLQLDFSRTTYYPETASVNNEYYYSDPLSYNRC